MKISLKELKETFVGLKIIERSKLLNDSSIMIPVKKEANELISIFVASINTASKRL